MRLGCLTCFLASLGRPLASVVSAPLRRLRPGAQKKERESRNRACRAPVGERASGDWSVLIGFT